MKDYVIGVKLKGQNVVMKEIDAVKKAGAKLAKTNFTAKVGSGGGRASFAGVRNEINARKQLERERRNAEATRGVREMEKRNATTFKNRLDSAKSGAATGRDVLGSAMTGGVSGIANTLPGAGAIFAAAEGSIQQAAQMFVQGVTASKNIKLVEANFGRAFGNSMNGAFKGTAFEFQNSGNANRTTQSTFATLAEQGVNASTLSKKENIDILSKAMQAQGISSLDEFFARAQSGQLKLGAGLERGHLSYAQSLAQGLNDKYSSEISMQGLLALLKSRSSKISASAGSGDLPSLAKSARKEQEIKDREENFAGEADAFEGSYNTGFRNRRLDRADMMKFQRLAQSVSNAKRAVIDRIYEAGDNINNEIENVKKYGLVEGTKKSIREYAARENAKEAKEQAEGGALQSGDSDDSYDTPGIAPLSQSNADLTRAGSALADTLNKINSQLMAVQYQMRTRGA